MNVSVSSLLEGTTFQPASAVEAKQRIILNVQGQEDTGKTHFLCSCPDPIAIFDLDHNLEGVVNKFKHKKIMFSPYHFHKPSKGSNETKLIKEADLLWARFISEYQEALTQVKTIAIDTAGLLWEMLRMARFGKLTQIMPHNYGPLNTEFAQIIDLAKLSDCNLVFSSTMSPEYIADSATGRWVRQGWSQLDYRVQFSLELSRVRSGSNKGDFQGTVLKFKPDPKMVGQVIIEPDFEKIFERAFPKGV